MAHSLTTKCPADPADEAVPVEAHLLTFPSGIVDHRAREWYEVWQVRLATAPPELVRTEPHPLAKYEEIDGAAKAFSGATAHGLDPSHVAISAS